MSECKPENSVYGKGPEGGKMDSSFAERKAGCCSPHLRDAARLICEMLLARQKRHSFLHRIVTGDENWIYFENPERKISSREPAISTVEPNRLGKTAMLCVWWDCKSAETGWDSQYRTLPTLNDRFEPRTAPKTARIQKKQHKVISLHHNAPAYTAKPVNKLLAALSWEILPHAAIQTLLHRVTTCSKRWDTLLVSSNY